MCKCECINLLLFNFSRVSNQYSHFILFWHIRQTFELEKSGNWISHTVNIAKIYENFAIHMTTWLVFSKKSKKIQMTGGSISTINSWLPRKTGHIDIYSKIVLETWN